MQKCLKLCQPVKSEELAKNQNLTNDKAKLASISFKSPQNIAKDMINLQNKKVPGVQTTTIPQHNQNYLNQAAQKASQTKKETLVIDDSLKALLGDDIEKNNQPEMPTSSPNNTAPQTKPTQPPINQSTQMLDYSSRTLEHFPKTEQKDNNGLYFNNDILERASSSKPENSKPENNNNNNKLQQQKDNSLYFDNKVLEHPNERFNLNNNILEHPKGGNQENVSMNAHNNVQQIRKRVLSPETQRQLEDLKKQKEIWLNDLKKYT